METVEIPMIHKAIHTPKKGDIILMLTDIQLHTNAEPTTNIVKKVETSIIKNKEGRIYSSLNKLAEPIIAVNEDGVMKFSLPFNQESLKSLIKKYELQGKRVFIANPNNLPIFAGQDTIEFMNSKKGKRIIRRFNKK